MGNKKIVTHNGKFHADDVFAVATLLLKLGDCTVVRSRDVSVINSADYVVDVGFSYDPSRNKFDHHQEGGAGVRQNGIPYASFGLVWKKYGEELGGSKEIADTIENKLVMFVDALDNGIDVSKSVFEDVRAYTISDYLYSYWIDESVPEDEVDRVFKRVVALAKNLLEREIAKNTKIEEEGKLVENIYNKTEDKRIIILDRNYAWGKKLVEKEEPLIVVYPSIDGESWYAKVVRKNLNTFDTRVLFPASWSAKTGKELADVSGVEDALFCHKALFLATARSKGGAIALAMKALQG